jgi:HSP20 family protein
MKWNPAKILDTSTLIFYYYVALRRKSLLRMDEINGINRWDSFRNLSTLQEQVNRLLEGSFPAQGDKSALTTWAPAVDIYETENELVLKADLPDINEKDLDVRVENNMLTIHGERKFEQKVKEENYLRVERSYGLFSRSFSLPSTINTEGIKAEYKNGTLTVELPKRAESKPKQVKINVNGSHN